MASVDLKRTFYSLRFSKSYRKYLKFIYRGSQYEVVMFTFGLGTPPQMFTNIMEPVIHHLRCKEIMSLLY